MFFKSLSKYVSQQALLFKSLKKAKSLGKNHSILTSLKASTFSSLLLSNRNVISENHHQYQDDQGSYNNSHSCVLLSIFGALASGLSIMVLCDTIPQQSHSENASLHFSFIQYPSNNPIEDRWSVYQLKALPGSITAVFDGHGGWQMAEFARKHLAKEIDERLGANKNKSFSSTDEYIITSIQEGFDQVENNFLEAARVAYNIGYGKVGGVGSCALLTLTHNGKIYVANLGDCQGVICKSDDNGGKVSLRKINKKLNANSKKEQERLRRIFKEEENNIVICRENDRKSCYVKGRLQPTRAFGDFDMKHEGFNNPSNLSREYGFYRKFEIFKGNYVTHKPEISVFDVEKDDKYLVLSTDGMWDELSRDDVRLIIEGGKGKNKQNITEELLNLALKKAAEKKNITEEEIKAIKVGSRRDHHDDMTIVIVDL